MNLKSLYILSIVILVIWTISCDRKEAFEPDPSVNIERLGDGLLINEDELHPNGLYMLVINTGDTTKLAITSILLNKANYEWQVANSNVMELVRDENDASIAYAIARGDSGTSTTLTLIDRGNNNAKKTIPVIISKYWADPVRFTFIGTLNKHYYYISNDIKGWAQAENTCEEVGGHLATITSQEEQTLLEDGRGSVVEVWIGLRFYKEPSETTWHLNKWVTGEPLDSDSFQNFVSKPADPGIFAEYYFYFVEDGKWENWHEITYHYFLEME